MTTMHMTTMHMYTFEMVRTRVCVQGDPMHADSLHSASYDMISCHCSALRDGGCQKDTDRTVDAVSIRDRPWSPRGATSPPKQVLT